MITPNNIKALFELYPQIISTIGDVAYDAQGNEVSYDLSAVQTKATELQAQADQQKQAAITKLTALGLTVDDLKTLIG
jgi:hypothetical protein